MDVDCDRSQVHARGSWLKRDRPIGKKGVTKFIITIFVQKNIDQFGSMLELIKLLLVQETASLTNEDRVSADMFALKPTNNLIRAFCPFNP